MHLSFHRWWSGVLLPSKSLLLQLLWHGHELFGAPLMQGSLGSHSRVAFLAHSEPAQQSGAVQGAYSGSAVLNPLLPKPVVQLPLPPLLSMPPLPSLPGGSPMCVPRPNLRAMSEPVPPSSPELCCLSEDLQRYKYHIFPFEDGYKLSHAFCLPLKNSDSSAQCSVLRCQEVSFVSSFPLGAPGGKGGQKEEFFFFHKMMRRRWVCSAIWMRKTVACKLWIWRRSWIIKPFYLVNVYAEGVFIGLGSTRRDLRYSCFGLWGKPACGWRSALTTTIISWMQHNLNQHVALQTEESYPHSSARGRSSYHSLCVHLLCLIGCTEGLMHAGNPNRVFLADRC